MRISDFVLEAGSQLNGFYEIDEPIAKGGIGIVYKAHDLETLGPVAIKVLHPEHAADPMFLKLFRREALILRDLHHEALARSFVFGRDPNLQVQYLAMEFIDGPSLAERLADGPLPSDVAYDLMCRIASGLDVAHQMGIVHRDISPDNILLPGGDVRNAKLIDFGIARSDEHGTTVIGSGFAGKEQYAAPEQVGLFGGVVSSSTDVYSLGLVIAHALTGERIDMGGSHVELVEKRKTTPVLSSVDPNLRPLLEAMLQPNPSNRLQGMDAVLSWSILNSEPAAHQRTGLTLNDTLENTLRDALEVCSSQNVLKIHCNLEEGSELAQKSPEIETIFQKNTEFGNHRSIRLQNRILPVLIGFVFFSAAFLYFVDFGIFKSKQGGHVYEGSKNSHSYKNSEIKYLKKKNEDNLELGKFKLKIGSFSSMGSAQFTLDQFLKPLLEVNDSVNATILSSGVGFNILLEGVSSDLKKKICEEEFLDRKCVVLRDDQEFDYLDFQTSQKVKGSFSRVDEISSQDPDNEPVKGTKSEKYVVQVTSQRSSEAASDAYAGLQRRFPSVLGKLSAVIVPADLGDKGMFYRVRIPVGNRDDAIELCENLQDAGGDCFARRQY